MSPEGSVSRLLEGFKAGDDGAVRSLWDRYCDRLVRLARRKLRNTGRRVADEEDVALSAFHSLCQGARGGQDPDDTRQREGGRETANSLHGHRSIPSIDSVEEQTVTYSA